MTDGTKTCPECAETVKAEAVLCKFCKYDFAAGQGARPVHAGTGAPPMPRRSGLHPLIIVLIIFAIGIPFIAIIAAIAIPGLLSSQRAANERNAAMTLKTIAVAEADFRANDRDNNQINDFWTGDVRHLYSTRVAGSEIKLIESSVAAADASPGGSGPPVPKAGYLFVALEFDEEGNPYDQGKGRHLFRYGFCAFPATSAAGRRVFIINEMNTVFFSLAPGGRPVNRWPANLSEGWSRLD